jgi:hypothetical protein
MTGIAYRRATIHRRGRAAVLVLVPLLLGACTARASPSPAATAGAAAGTAQLRIAQVRVSASLPIEGSLSYVRLERTGGTTVTERLPDSGKLTLTVRPGAYRLVSWQRICDANCGNLDPPSNRCTRPFTLRKGEQLQAVIRLDWESSGCAIVLRH